MKILVTGAAGKIGSAVARELLEHGHQVRCLDVAAVAADLRPRVETTYADVSDRMWDFERFGFWDTRVAQELFGFVAKHGWEKMDSNGQTA